MVGKRLGARVATTVILRSTEPALAGGSGYCKHEARGAYRAAKGRYGSLAV